MSKPMQLVILAVLLVPLSYASTCPVTLVTGTIDRDAISITFRNAGKLPIRRLEFQCTLAQQGTHKATSAVCREQNALFFPGSEYTVSYAYAGGVPRPVRVSVKSLTLGNGFVFKPSQRQPCRALRIRPEKKKK